MTVTGDGCLEVCHTWFLKGKVRYVPASKGRVLEHKVIPGQKALPLCVCKTVEGTPVNLQVLPHCKCSQLAETGMCLYAGCFTAPHVAPALIGIITLAIYVPVVLMMVRSRPGPLPGFLIGPSTGPVAFLR
jgi:hypothetical protein